MKFRLFGLILLFVKFRLSTQTPYTQYIRQHSDFKQGPIDFSDFFSLDDWLPIEINVPDTAMEIWQGAEYAWTTVSDYLSAENQEAPRIPMNFV